MQLTTKQMLFVKEYVACKNATQAALKAGYSEKSASVIGSENLTKPEILSAIEQELQLVTDAINHKMQVEVVSKQEWLEELRRIAFSDIDDFIEVVEQEVTVPPPPGPHGLVSSEPTTTIRVVAMPKLTRQRKALMGRVIKKLGENKNGITIELHDKMRALELIGRHFKWIGEAGLEVNAENVQVVVTMPDNGRMKDVG